MEQTTVPHIVAARIDLEVNYPDDVKGDLIKEHNFLLFSNDGPKIMLNHKKVFEDVCKEVDYAINEGVAHFSDEGIITVSRGN